MVEPPQFKNSSGAPNFKTMFQHLVVEYTVTKKVYSLAMQLFQCKMLFRLWSKVRNVYPNSLTGCC